MPLLRLLEVWLSMIDYEKLDALAQKLMLNRKAHLNRERGFIYHHGKRVAVSIITLRKMATEDDSHDDALRIAAMFHDVGKGVEPHNRTGAAIVKELLAGELPPALLDEVARLIRAHVERPTENLWEGLLQDADLVDHFGTVDVGMSFQYGAFHETGMAETLAWFRDEFDENAERNRANLNFDFSRAIFDEKVAYTREFAARLAVELKGGYV